MRLNIANGSFWNRELRRLLSKINWAEHQTLGMVRLDCEIWAQHAM